MPYSPRSTERRILRDVRRRYGITTPQEEHDKKKKNSSAATNDTKVDTSSTPSPQDVPQQSSLRQPRRKHYWLRRLTLLMLVCTLVVAGVFSYRILSASNKITVAERSILGQLKDLLFTQGTVLEGEQEGRLNIMLIAVGGEGHEGENLADTIIVASISPQVGKAALLSIPRDLYVQVPGEEFYSKINAVHAYGESKRKNFGPELLRKKISEIVGLPIHYYGRIDFTAFKNIIDAVGGVEITIEKSFYDYWHKISFPAGTERMNGERALAYVRARYIEGSEGGDFKRAARQQQVLLALRDKVFSVQTAFDFGRLNTIFNSLSDNIRTDMELWELKRLYEIARTISHEQVKSEVLSTGPKGVLVGETEVLGGSPAAILRPRTGDYTEIQQIAAALLDAVSPPSEPLTTLLPPSPSTEPSSTTEQIQQSQTPTLTLSHIEVRNGTNITGLAKRVADELKKKGYEIAAVGNATVRTNTTTVVYALNEPHTDSAKELASILSAQTDSGLPQQEEPSIADVLIILGTDAQTSTE